MKLWIIKANINLPKEDNPWDPDYDTCVGMIIQAKTEESARSIADTNSKQETSDEVFSFNNKIYTSIHPWLDKKYSTCQELTATEDEKLILRDVRMA